MMRKKRTPEPAVEFVSVTTRFVGAAATCCEVYQFAGASAAVNWMV